MISGMVSISRVTSAAFESGSGTPENPVSLEMLVDHQNRFVIGADPRIL